MTHDFLDLDPELRYNEPGFENGLMIFKNVRVVNDIAERGISLTEQYNNFLTKNEEQLQYVLQVVQNHRKQFPNCHKKPLSSVQLPW